MKAIQRASDREAGPRRAPPAMCVLGCHYNQGFTAEMLLGQFPTLELALVHKVIVFYLEHRDEVDRYVRQYQSDIDRFRASSQHAPSVTKLRERLEARELAEPVDADRV